MIRKDLCSSRKLTQFDVINAIAAAFLYSVTVITIVIIVGGVQLESSGTLCSFPFASYAAAGIFGVVGVIGPLHFLLYNAYVTYRTITKAQKQLEALGIQEQAKSKYRQSAKKLGYFFITTITCYNVGTFTVAYEWSTGQYVPPAGSFAVEMSVLFLSCFINPSLFFHLNVDLREKFWEVVGVRLYRMFDLTLMEPVKLSFSKVSRRISLRHLRISSSSIFPVGKSEITDSYIDRDNFKFWLSDESLSKIIKDHARKEYVMENFLFYEDASLYRNKGTNILKIIRTLRETDTDVEKFCEALADMTQLNADWKDLETMANKLYTLYIQVTPSSRISGGLKSYCDCVLGS